MRGALRRSSSKGAVQEDMTDAELLEKLKKDLKAKRINKKEYDARVWEVLARQDAARREERQKALQDALDAADDG